MDSRPIGVFDSGLGGLTCVAELMKVLPDEDIVYFGDTARVPYGTRSRNTIIEYAQQDAAFIRNKGVKLMIAACGTVSSALGDVDISGGLPFTGVVEPAAAEAVNAAENGIIGVIGTAATIASGAYEASIKRISPDIKVYSQACKGDREALSGADKGFGSGCADHGVYSLSSSGGCNSRYVGRCEAHIIGSGCCKICKKTHNRRLHAKRQGRSRKDILLYQ